MCNVQHILGDEAYDCNVLLEQIAQQGAFAAIPSPANYVIDQHIYKERHLIKRFFNKIKHYRPIFPCFSRYLHIASLKSTRNLGQLIIEIVYKIKGEGDDKASTISNRVDTYSCSGRIGEGCTKPR